MANACEYEGVSVCMSRTHDACQFVGSGSIEVDIAAVIEIDEIITFEILFIYSGSPDELTVVYFGDYQGYAAVVCPVLKARSDCGERLHEVLNSFVSTPHCSTVVSLLSKPAVAGFDSTI